MKQPTNALRLYPMIAKFVTRKELSGKSKKDVICLSGKKTLLVLTDMTTIYKDKGT